MKQLIFMVLATSYGTVGAFRYEPFCGVFIFYLFAVLRPQWCWEWVLPVVPWSFIVGWATIVSVLLHQPSTDEGGPAQGTLVPLSGAHRLVLLFGCWVSLTYFTARNQEAAYLVFIEYLKIFIFFYVAARAIRTTGQVWSLFLMTGLTIGYIAYEVNDIYFNQGGYITIYHRGYCGLDNNGAGLMVAMGVPLVFFAWEGVQKWYRWGFLLLIPVIVHAVLMSYSRGAMLSLVVTVPVYFLRSRRKLQVLAIAGIMAFLVPMMAGNEIRARFFTISDNEVDESAKSRRTTWAIGWRMALENPIVGLGIRNSNLYTHQYGADFYGRTIHSQYLQTAADSGLVALGLYLGALGTVWWSLRNVRKATAKRFDLEGSRAYAIACGAEGSLAVFAFGAIFLSLENFELPYLLMLIGAQLWVVLSPPTDEYGNSVLAHDTNAEQLEPAKVAG